MFDIQKAFHKNFPKLVKRLPKPLTQRIINTLRKIFHEETFQAIYAKNHHLRGLDFVDSMLENLNIRYTLQYNELKNIPSEGRLLVVANHITGASDAFALVQLLGTLRDDKKVRLLVNGMLMGVEQASEIIIGVDNINGSITKESFKEINNALKNDEAVVLFPSGIVNRFSLFKGLKDTPWKPSFLKMAKRTNTPILPVRIKSRNSIQFYILSMLLPKKLTGFMLPHEFATAGEQKPLHFHIGNVIPVKTFSDKNISLDTYVKMFYNHLYTLGTNKKPLLQTEITISNAHNKMMLREEVRAASFLGNTIDGKRIILADALSSPFLTRELGRVREISFRAIGGGTGTAQDNDLYDNYYRHLILWDNDDFEIVGAYRIGEVKGILKDKGMPGLYTYNQCNFNEHFNSYCDNSVELGRSFIQPKYWNSRALDNLWQGVGAYLANNPQIRYTYGVVTINANTPKKAVAALVYFYSHHFSCHTNMMEAKEPYFMSYEDSKEFKYMFNHLNYKEGFIVLKKYLKTLNTTVPTLFKQYAELYEEGAVRFFDFSINEKLHGVVEGFIIADNSRMKESKRKRYIKNFQNIDEKDIVVKSLQTAS